MTKILSGVGRSSLGDGPAFAIASARPEKVGARVEDAIMKTQRRSNILDIKRRITEFYHKAGDAYWPSRQNQATIGAHMGHPLQTAHMAHFFTNLYNSELEKLSQIGFHMPHSRVPNPIGIRHNSPVFERRRWTSRFGTGAAPSAHATGFEGR
ncbi:hypothetical protein L1787_08150 [Acuticoccus sp. M5D2P5]|uniref:hypothetical protein n=1 Tax=Acuticoccus kalidii TaxID=2910977 RepID=UPI001F1E3515|nr:hypothetical protein [Acuticoccus kalidii]MCF3933379.1 hypothetical protein [Acuticoccus kalidii]